MYGIYCTSQWKHIEDPHPNIPIPTTPWKYVYIFEFLFIPLTTHNSECFDVHYIYIISVHC